MNLYAIVLAVIVAVLLAVSLSQIRKVKTKADYLVAGRTLPWYVLVFTLLSSWIGSVSLFGGAENAFKNGFPPSLAHNHASPDLQGIREKLAQLNRHR